MAKMQLDRNLQHKILQELREVYPSRQSVQNLACFKDVENFHGNLIYLSEHSLVKGKIMPTVSRDRRSLRMPMATITAEGLDFLEDDGGLGAILGKVVVKFDDDDLALLLRTIELSKGSPEEKARFASMIKSLPAEGLKTVYTRLLNIGLDNLPDALHSVEKLLENLQ